MWNTQGLFAAVPENESQKLHYVSKLMADKDFGCFTETHSNRGNIFAANLILAFEDSGLTAQTVKQGYQFTLRRNS